MHENRSLFFPLTLIAGGILWLMINAGRIPTENLWALTHLWPFFLIALGAGLILRSFWRPLGMLVSALVVAGAFLAVVYAPRFGWNDAPPMKLESGIFGAVPGSGVIETENREAEDFDSISIRYPAEVTIRQGAVESLTIEAEDNVLAQLRSEVSSGTLTIETLEKDFSKRVTPSEQVKITIVVKDLHELVFTTAGELTIDGLKTDQFTLSLSGAGDVLLSDLDVEQFELSLSGAGSITVQGEAHEFNATISGLGNIEAEGLAVSVATVRISGAGSATVRVEDELNAAISGAGSIDYYGDPELHKNVSGAGSIERAGE